MFKKYSLVLTLSLVLSLSLLFGGITATAQEDKVTFATSMAGQELEVLKELMNQAEEDLGIQIEVQQLSRDIKASLGPRVEAGNPPDMTNIAQPGLMKTWAKKGFLQPLEWFKDTEQADNMAAGFMETFSQDGTLYGIAPAASVKSLVWYNKKVFEEEGYEEPETIGELLKLQNEIVSDGYTPWAFGLESGNATGWPATDWIEDIMLRVAGPEVYDQWVSHDISWTDPRVAQAFRIFDLFVNEDMVMGGRKTALTMHFGDSVQYILPGEGRDKPRALMHRQATFIQDFLEDAHPDAQAGEDYGTFIFPTIGNESPPILFAGDAFIAFRDKPAVRELLTYFASPKIQQMWVEKNPGRLAVNTQVPLSAYPEGPVRTAAEGLQEAGTARFDGSDSMVAAVGTGSFWTGMVDFVQGNKSLESVLNDIEDSADDSYESGAATD
jgi:alpha-glucoside transport system substrate-binding protein